MIAAGEDYSDDMQVSMHKTVKKVSEDFESMKFNTAIAALMSLVNEFYGKERINRAEIKTFLVLLNPVSPHITEEIWENLGFKGRISESSWPGWDEDKTIEDMVEIAVQINGKVRDRIMVRSGLDSKGVSDAAMKNEKVLALTDGKTVVKVIGVPDKLVNVVVR
jgi:leucyl-tRNA synthetase